MSLNSLPRQNSGDVLCDNDSVGTRNEEQTAEDPDQYEERFRVDRKKLEQMLHGKKKKFLFSFVNNDLLKLNCYYYHFFIGSEG